MSEMFDDDDLEPSDTEYNASALVLAFESSQPRTLTEDEASILILFGTWLLSGAKLPEENN